MLVDELADQRRSGRTAARGNLWRLRDLSRGACWHAEAARPRRRQQRAVPPPLPRTAARAAVPLRPFAAASPDRPRGCQAPPLALPDWQVEPATPWNHARRRPAARLRQRRRRLVPRAWLRW